jgi:hypothetical protein
MYKIFKKMREHELNLNDFILDEIESIELVGEEETIDITVEDTHMFYANDIYTHNSSISSDVVTGDQMGGSIKKAQIAHLIISIARTLPQKEANRATLAIIKSRFGKDGVIFEDCTFHNGKLLIDTQTSDTFLGYEKKQIEKKEESQRERLKKIKDRKGNDQSVDNN